MSIINKHSPGDLKMMQSLPLDAKIALTQKRIEAWYESWKRYEIYNTKTDKTRYVTACEEPALKDYEYIDSAADGQVYVSFSGGKDSTVLKHIVDSMYSDVPALFVNTGLEFPELQRFVREVAEGIHECFNSDVNIVRPAIMFNEVLKTHGYPIVSKEVAQIVREARIGLERNDGSYSFRIQKLNGELRDKNGNLSQFNKKKWKFLLDADFRISEKCCTVMKKDPAKLYERENGRRPLIATMAAESALRKQRWIRHGCNSFNESRPASNPMSFWTEQDVLEYIKRFNVPYASVYGDIVETDKGLTTTGYSRTGCIFCAFGAHCESNPNRFQMLKQTHPRQYDYCIGGGEMVDGKWQPSKEGLGLGRVLDYIGVDY